MWKEQMQMKEGESTGTGRGGDVRAVAAATASDRCTGSVGARTAAVTGAAGRDQRRMIDRWGQMFDSCGHPRA